MGPVQPTLQPRSELVQSPDQSDKPRGVNKKRIHPNWTSDREARVKAERYQSSSRV